MARNPQITVQFSGTAQQLYDEAGAMEAAWTAFRETLRERSNVCDHEGVERPGLCEVCGYWIGQIPRG